MLRQPICFCKNPAHNVPDEHLLVCEVSKVVSVPVVDIVYRSEVDVCWSQGIANDFLMHSAISVCGQKISSALTKIPEPLFCRARQRSVQLPCATHSSLHPSEICPPKISQPTFLPAAFLTFNHSGHCTGASQSTARVNRLLMGLQTR